MKRLLQFIRSHLNSIVPLVFFAVGLVGILHHELWRDEFQAYLIAQRSHSIAELLFNSRFEGHPRLWFFLLYILTRFTQAPFAMQVVHLGLATIGIVLFVRFSPFTKVQKILGSFGYYTLYEYGVISRNYVLSVLFAFLFCTLFPTRKKTYLWVGLALFLLTQTSVEGLILTFALTVLLFFEPIISLDMRKVLPWKRWITIIPILLVMAGALLSVWQLVPQYATGIGEGWSFRWDSEYIVRTIATITRSYMPIPRLSMQFWNSNILGSWGLEAGVSIIFLTIGFLVFAGSPPLLITYLVGTGSLLAFFYFRWFGFSRHHGYLFLLFLVLAWLQFLEKGRDFHFRFFGRGFAITSLFRKNILTLVFLLQFIGAIAALGFDFVYPFSESKQTAEYIQAHNLNNMVIVADYDYAGTPVAGYLDRDVYFPQRSSMGSFVFWDYSRHYLDYREVLAKANTLATKRGEDVLILLNYPMTNLQNLPYQIEFLASFTRSVVPDEVYFLFRMRQGK